jgi:hypothetical protein
MSESLTNIAGSLIAQKGASAVLNYTLDYAPDLLVGEVLTNSVWTEATGDLTLTQGGYTNTQTTITIAGGTAGRWYVVTNVATGGTGLVHEASINLFIGETALLGTGLFSPFPSIPGALAEIRRDRLTTMLQTYLPAGTVISDDYLLQKLMAAQSYISHRLRVFLVPTQVLPNTATQTEIDLWANPVSGPPMPVYLEPAYDYDPDMFQGNTWGRTLTRQRPIIRVQSMSFVYPTPTSTLFSIPNEWIRLDKKYGVINLLPIQTAMSLPLNAFILSALGGGRIVPEFLEIRYQAGLTNVLQDWPEILDLVRRQAVLGIAQDLFLPSSRNESVSADGLSQSSSIGFAIDSYESMVDKQMDAIKSALFGVQMFSV